MVCVMYVLCGDCVVLDRIYCDASLVFFSRRGQQTMCALVTVGHPCTLPITGRTCLQLLNFGRAVRLADRSPHDVPPANILGRCESAGPFFAWHARAYSRDRKGGKRIIGIPTRKL